MNGYVATDIKNGATYRKPTLQRRDGVCFLSGLVDAQAATSPLVLYLPAHCVPQERHKFAVYYNRGTAAVDVCTCQFRL